MQDLFGRFRVRAKSRAASGFGGILVIVAVCTTGCASLGPAGATRFDAARALGLPPSDVILLSRDYELSGGGDNKLALANYTVKTRSDQTYTCTLAPSHSVGHLPAMQPVCVPKY